MCRSGEDVWRSNCDKRGCAVVALSRQSVLDFQDHWGAVWELLFPAPRVAHRQDAVPEYLRATRNSWCRPVAGDGAHGVAQRDTLVHLEGAARRRTPAREWWDDEPRFRLC